MIIRITIDKGRWDEEKIYIYCPNKINIKWKNVKLRFFEWYNKVDSEEYELVDSMYGNHSLECMIVYWINKYILESEYGNKAYVLQENIDEIKNCDIDINIENYFYD